MPVSGHSCSQFIVCPRRCVCSAGTAFAEHIRGFGVESTHQGQDGQAAGNEVRSLMKRVKASHALSLMALCCCTVHFDRYLIKASEAVIATKTYQQAVFDEACRLLQGEVALIAVCFARLLIECVHIRYRGSQIISPSTRTPSASPS